MLFRRKSSLRILLFQQVHVDYEEITTHKYSNVQQGPSFVFIVIGYVDSISFTTISTTIRSKNKRKFVLNWYRLCCSSFSCAGKVVGSRVGLKRLFSNISHAKKIDSTNKIIIFREKSSDHEV